MNIIYILVALSIFLVNVPFGAWRVRERKLSLRWFLAIHIPVLITIGLRKVIGIPFDWGSFFLFIFMFFSGQTTGKFLYERWRRNRLTELKEH